MGFSYYFYSGIPGGNRTPVAGMKILSPGPLDDGDILGCFLIGESDGDRTRDIQDHNLAL